MKINKEAIKALNPCKNRFDNFTTEYPDFNGELKEFISLENITYSDKVWVVTSLFTHEQNINWSILCAESVLHIFETKYPDDKRPRLAIEAAKIGDKDADAAYSAASADAAYSAASADAAYAAYSAANAARAAANASAYYAARAAANASAYYAARAAANAAAYSAANAAYAGAGEKEQEQLNLQLMLEV